MSSPAPTPVPTVTVQGSNATPHWMVIFGTIMAALQAAGPIVFHIIPPKVAAGIELGEELEPVVVSTIGAIQQINTGPSSTVTP